MSRKGSRKVVVTNPRRAGATVDEGQAVRVA